MRRNEWLEVGFVKDAHGIRGELYIQLFAEKVDWLERLSQIHLRKRNEEGPPAHSLNIKAIRPHRQGFIVRCEELKDRNEAETFKGMTYLIPSSALVSEKGEPIYLYELLEFTVKDPTGNALGKITGFLSNGAQDLLQVKREDGGVSEIPLVAPFIVDVDFENESITMDLPEGLMDLEV